MNVVTKEQICALETEAEGCRALRERLEHFHRESSTAPQDGERNWMLLAAYLCELEERMRETAHFAFAERIRLMRAYMLDSDPTEENWGNLFLQMRNIEKEYHCIPAVV